jgi:Flp pilus assembly pilin Flp
MDKVNLAIIHCQELSYKFMRRLIKDESGQGATEYILLLVVVVAIAMIFKKQIQQIVSDKINEVSTSIGSFSVQGGN